MAGTYTWQETYSIAKDQGLSDVDAAKSANTWAQQGGKAIETNTGGYSATKYAAPTSWTDDQYKSITGITKPAAAAPSAGFTLNPKVGAGTVTAVAPGAQAPASYFPGQTSMEQMLSNMPKYSPLSEGDMQSQAQNYADIQVNPQATALQKSLQNALTALANQENSVNANYAGLQTSAEEAKKSAAKRALESAVSRGMGRSGAVEWETAEATKPIDSALMNAEAAKTADLNNLGNNRTLAQQAYDTSIEGLEAQRGSLVAQQIAAIKERDYALQTGDWERATSLQTTISQLANQSNQYQNNLLRTDTQMMGQTPEGINGTDGTGNTGLRDYASSKGATVGWDASSGNVSIKNASGQTYAYSPSQLVQYGAVLKDGKWLIPQSMADSLF